MKRNNLISFSIPTVTGDEKQYVLEPIDSFKISGDGEFTKRCHKWLEEKLECTKVLLTTSCTHSLAMVAILLDIQEGDEKIIKVIHTIKEFHNET